MGLINLLYDTNLNWKFCATELEDLHSCIPEEIFRVLRGFVSRMTAIFRNTYQSELFFSPLRTVQ
jgi:hypothetical protein